jgi:hypothetical protein
MNLPSEFLNPHSRPSSPSIADNHQAQPNPQSERSSPAAAGNPQSKTRARGRPFALDDAKRREICALVAGGCSLNEAARYVRCSLKTIRREMRRNPDFHEQFRRSEMFAQLAPLRAMQQAAGTHWRAAAWMLERAYPDRFARRNPAAFSAGQARSLLNEVLQIVRSEVHDTFQHERIEKRLRATFEYTIRTACDIRRSSDDLRRAIRFFEEKDRLNDPLAAFGISSPNWSELLDKITTPKPPRPPRHKPGPSVEQPPNYVPAGPSNCVPEHAPRMPTNT